MTKRANESAYDVDKAIAVSQESGNSTIIPYNFLDFADAPQTVNYKEEGRKGTNEVDPRYQADVASWLKNKNYTIKTGEDADNTYSWVEDADGNRVGEEQFTNKRDSQFDFIDAIIPAIMTMGAGAGAGAAIGNALGLSGNLATAAGSGIINAGVTAARGGDWKQALLSTAGSLATSGLGSLVGVNDLNPQLSAAINGGVRSAIKGDDFLTGAIQGGVNSFISTGNPVLDGIMKQAIGKQVPKILG